VPGCTVLDLTVSLGQNGSVKPREVLQAAVQGTAEGHRAIRVALLDEMRQPIFEGQSERGDSWVTAPGFAVDGTELLTVRSIGAG
jgi:hypothetical protein